MEGPQKENGFTPIANEILENMAKIKLSPTQYRILFVVWRYTYGFNRKEHELSLSFLSTATGCDKRQLQRELKGLEERKVIIQSIKTGAYRKIKFNKHHKQWVGEIAIGETSIGETSIGEIDNGESVNTAIGETVNTSIGETDNQERKTKDNIKESAFLDLFETVWKEYPNKKGKGQISETKKKELSKVGYEQLIRCIERYKKYVKSKDWLEYQNGSTFFNSGYIDYLDANVEDKPKQKETKDFKMVYKEL
jgi:phage replication O-like protein O